MGPQNQIFRWRASASMTSRLRAFLLRFLSLSPHTAPCFSLSRVNFLKALICGIALSFGASFFAVAQVETEAGAAARRSKVMAFESAWGIAEKGKDAKALDALLDDSLAYTDYDGTLKTKSDFLAEVKSPEHNREQQVVESTSVRVYGNTAVVIGVYRVKGLDQGKPYQRRGRFTDTWVNRDGNWVCVASQYTLLSR
jgi:ketosteroid isomerase-like protein